MQYEWTKQYQRVGQASNFHVILGAGTVQPLSSIEVSMPLHESQLCAYYAARAGEYHSIYLKPERLQDLGLLLGL